MYYSYYSITALSLSVHIRIVYYIDLNMSSLQGKLASVHNAETNHFINKILAPGYDVFLGSFMVGTNRYAWLDDSEWDFNNWNSSDTKNIEKDHLCTYMSKENGKWLFGSCIESKTFICQYQHY